MADEKPTGVAQAGNFADPYSAAEFMVQQITNRMATATIVKVVAVGDDNNELAPVGTVDIQPIVQQMTGAGIAVPHGIIHNVPFLRIQGGKNAVIIDPQVDDLGIAIFASHDITKVKSTKDEALPGSRRRYDWGDALYLGGVLNDTPEQYIWFDSEGDIHIKPKTTLYVDGDVEVTGTVTASEDVVADGVSLHDHTHSGVQTGSGDTGAPN